ncbi:MAG: hypothetical protein MUF04_05470 [Akkermansiaceae bacterium]|jgi:hypothetical protein|nr:hypothetical protein [Akkermansiaceae bacterium]
MLPFRIAACVLTIFPFGAGIPAYAQGGGADKAAKVEFRVTRFDPGDRESPKFRAGSGERSVEIEVPLNFIAGPFEAPLRDDTTLDLWQGSAEKPAVSLAIAPAERKHLLLVFFHEGETFRVLKVLTPPDRIKGGDRFIINVTPHEMAVKLGDGKPLMIPAGKSGLLAAPQESEIVSLPVLVSLKHGEEWKLASTESWPHDPRFRRFLVAYLSPISRQLVFHILPERM